MNNTKEKMKNEAIRRLQILVDKLGLDASVVDKFKTGQLCLSCQNLLGIYGVFNFEKDWHYQKDVNAFENETGYMVYHVVEDPIGLDFFYVKEDEETDWDISDGWAMVYGMVFNQKYFCSEYGYMRFKAVDGALVRIG